MNMAKRKETDFKSTLIGSVPCKYQLGHELHVMTSSAFNDRVLNIRLNRVIPSVTGYTGYTRTGFMLTRDEGRILLEKLLLALNDDDVWEEDVELNMVEMDDD
tara:strand:- start:6164 stop:6472 length:309 start_codon:yes stop_codon:yes gene_type:complete